MQVPVYAVRSREVPENTARLVDFLKNLNGIILLPEEYMHYKKRSRKPYKKIAEKDKRSIVCGGFAGADAYVLRNKKEFLFPEKDRMESINVSPSAQQIFAFVRICSDIGRFSEPVSKAPLFLHSTSDQFISENSHERNPEIFEKQTGHYREKIGPYLTENALVAEAGSFRCAIYNRNFELVASEKGKEFPYAKYVLKI